jgi:hypothetical protein
LCLAVEMPPMIACRPLDFDMTRSSFPATAIGEEGKTRDRALPEKTGPWYAWPAES